MKTYTIQVEDTVAEFFEDIAGILGKPADAVIADVLFLRAEKSRQDIENDFSVDINA